MKLKPLSLSLLALSAAAGLAITQPTQTTHAATSPNGKSVMVYYRAWRDKQMYGVNTDLPDHNVQSMLDLPEGIDIVNVFSYVPGGQEAQAKPFFDTLKSTYVPELHKRGVKVTRALGYGTLLNVTKEYGPTPTDEQYDAFAKALVEDLSGQYGLDGLDIDMEEHPTAEQIAVTDKVINALSNYIGPKADNGTLFVYDTNASDMGPFQNVKDCFDYVGYQQYGDGTDRTKKAVSDYEKVGLPSQNFMPGLTFPEEGDPNNRWYDTNTGNFAKSNIYQLSQLAKTNLKGMFLYGVDRDGRTYNSPDFNHMFKTTYRWTKTAILETKGYSLKQVQNAASQRIEKLAAVQNWKPGKTATLLKDVSQTKSMYDTISVLFNDHFNASVDPLFDPVAQIEGVDKPILTKQVVTVGAATGAAVANHYGPTHVVSKTLPAGSRWASLAQVDAGGQTWYNLGGDQWVASSQVTSDRNIKPVAVKGTATVNYVPHFGIAVWDSYQAGRKATCTKLPHASKWQVFSKVTLADGHTWYNLGGDQWADGQYLNVK